MKPFAVSQQETIDDDGKPDRMTEVQLHEQVTNIDDEEEVQAATSKYAIPEKSPSRKRRKLSATSHQPSMPIAVSSSRSDPERDHDDVERNVSDQSGSGFEDIAEPAFRTPRPISRFRSAAVSHDIEMPSLSRPAFKSLANKFNLDLESGVILPDAFSPSRRKGRQDYISGGFADTVRSWVLNAASSEVQSGNKVERILNIRDVESDRSGRAILVMDDENEKWLLIGKQEGQEHASTREHAQRIWRHSQIIIRGTSTHWTLPIVEDNHASQLLHAAAHWTVATPKS